MLSIAYAPVPGIPARDVQNRKLKFEVGLHFATHVDACTACAAAIGGYSQENTAQLPNVASAVCDRYIYTTDPAPNRRYVG
jgi:hypothetical protein